MKHTASESGQFDKDEFLLHVGLKVWKVTRSFVPEPTASPTHESICENGTQYGSFSNFADNCGTSYVSSQKLGGWMLLTMEITTQDEETKQDIGTELGLNLGEDTNIGFSKVNTVLSEYSSEISQIYMNTAGLMEPLNVRSIDRADETSSDSGVFTVSLQDIVNYKNAVDNNFEQAYDTNDPHAPEYGVVLDATRKEYLDNQLSACGLNTSENGEAYQCATASFVTAGRFEDSLDRLEEMIDNIDNYMNHDEDYTWGGKIQEKKSDLQALKTRIEDCRKTDIPNMKQACAAAVTNNEVSYFCNECDIGDACDVGKITTQYESVTDGIRRDRGLAEHTSYAARGNTSVFHGAGPSTSLCALQKVSGKYRTDNDGVQLRQHPNYLDWELKVTEEGAGSRGKSYRHSSRMGCVGHNEFHDDSRTNDGDPNTPEPDFTLDNMMTSPQRAKSGDTNTVNLGTNNKMARPISQYNGTSNGLGERVKTLPPGTGQYGIVRAKSAAIVSPDYGIKGSAFTFGFPDSDIGGQGPMTQPFDVATNGTEERMMAEVDDAICYLTEVSGEFDGAGEKASVYVDGYHWYLEVDSVCHSRPARRLHPHDCDNKEIEATARCYYYDHG